MKAFNIFVTLLVIAFGLGTLNEACAQSIMHVAEIEEIEPGTSPKALFSALVELMPAADVAHDADTKRLTIRANMTLSYSELELVATENGFALISLQYQ